MSRARLDSTLPEVFHSAFRTLQDTEELPASRENPYYGPFFSGASGT